MLQDLPGTETQEGKRIQEECAAEARQCLQRAGSLLYEHSYQSSISRW